MSAEDVFAAAAGKLQVVDNEKCEQATTVLCTRTADMKSIPHNAVHETCSKCGEAVATSPHSPKGPPRVCMQCAEPMLREQWNNAEFVINEGGIRQAAECMAALMAAGTRN